MIGRVISKKEEIRALEFCHELPGLEDVEITKVDLDGPYLNKCMESLGDNLVVVEATYKHITIGMSLSFIDENEISCHLALTLP